MIVQGRSIANEILEDLKHEINERKTRPRLAVITCAPTFETQKFLHIKKKRAEEIGVELVVHKLGEEVDTHRCLDEISEAAKDSDGIVVQLPFPSHIDDQALLDAIPATHDVDAFNVIDEWVLPPVLGAIKEILEREHIEISGKQCVVVGKGKLVGAPAAYSLERMGGMVEIVTKGDTDLKKYTKAADIIVLGAGVPGLLKPEMIKDGAIILDAGTSEAAGKLSGDADPRCAEKASVFTPVPGGIGPITVAILFRNLTILANRP